MWQAAADPLPIPLSFLYSHSALARPPSWRLRVQPSLHLAVAILWPRTHEQKHNVWAESIRGQALPPNTRLWVHSCGAELPPTGGAWQQNGSMPPRRRHLRRYIHNQFSWETDLNLACCCVVVFLSQQLGLCAAQQGPPSVVTWGRPSCPPALSPPESSSTLPGCSASSLCPYVPGASLH